MLQMNCPECESIIASPFLTEIPNVNCQDCCSDVPVKDVSVVTKFFSMNRDDLLSRVSHYRTLLKKIEKERTIAGEPSEENKSSSKHLGDLYTALREFLAGARENYRLDIDYKLPVDIFNDQKVDTGSLLNLSTSGAAIRLSGLNVNLNEGSTIKILTVLYEGADIFSTEAKVAWISNNEKNKDDSNRMAGVSFLNLSNDQLTNLRDFIVKTHNQSATPVMEGRLQVASGLS